MLPKVLIAAPTANTKNYCFNEWINNISKFTYLNFDVALFDNTDDVGENTTYLNETYKKNYGTFGKFLCLKSKTNNEMDIMEKLAISHNDCKNYCLEKKLKLLERMVSRIWLILLLKSMELEERLRFNSLWNKCCWLYKLNGKSDSC